MVETNDLVVMEKIKDMVSAAPIHIFMKGTPQFPQCGFSARAVEMLRQCTSDFSYTNVFLDREIYENLPAFSDWPTFPQIFIKGELLGGCDIVTDLFHSGELKVMIDNIQSQS